MWYWICWIKWNININFHLFLVFYLINWFILFLERGEGREKERERNINVWLPLIYPQLGTWPVSQACALTGNWTGDLFGSQEGTQSTEPHQPGLLLVFFFFNWDEINKFNHLTTKTIFKVYNSVAVHSQCCSTTISV